MVRCEVVREVVPRLEEVEECQEVPREVCQQVRTRAKQVERPHYRRDCHRPSVLLSVLP